MHIGIDIEYTLCIPNWVEAISVLQCRQATNYLKTPNYLIHITDIKFHDQHSSTLPLSLDTQWPISRDRSVNDSDKWMTALSVPITIYYLLAGELLD